MDAVREELRLATAHVARLRDDNAALEQRLLRPTSFRTWRLAGIVVSLAAGAAGFAIATHAAALHDARERAISAAERSTILERQRTGIDTCKLNASQAELALKRCDYARKAPVPGVTPLHVTPAPPCTCQVGDPLCSCL